jgi:serine/threonine-protein kinase HipA
MKGAVYNNGVLAGYLEKAMDGRYIFTYEDKYFAEKENPPISLTLPKNNKQHESVQLFPFFYGILSEGVNKDIQCRLLKIDEQDDFTRLLETAGEDTIGAITVKKITHEL